MQDVYGQVSMFHWLNTMSLVAVAGAVVADQPVHVYRVQWASDNRSLVQLYRDE